MTWVLSGCGGSSSVDAPVGNNWTRPETLATDTSGIWQGTDPIHVAMDNNGNSIIAWGQSDGTNQQIYMSTYSNGSWTHPTDLTTDAISVAGQNARNPHVAMDINGNAIIVWEQSDGANPQIYMSEYRSGSWTHPTSLTTDTISVAAQQAYSPQVSMDNNGNAIIVWGQSDGKNWQIYMSEYRNGSWTHPRDLATDAISVAGQNAYSPQVAMDNHGNAIITWNQFTLHPPSGQLVSQIYMSEYRIGSWTHPTDPSDAISTVAWLMAHSPQVAMDDAGSAIIVWSQIGSIYMSEYSDGSWAHPTDFVNDSISGTSQIADSPQVVIDNNGNAIIAWQQSDGTNEQIYMSTYRNGSWTHPTDLTTDAISVAGQDAYSPQVARDNDGNATIAWVQEDGTNSNINLSEYRNGNWGHPTDLATDATSITGLVTLVPKIAMDNKGNVVIVWQQYDGGFSRFYMSESR